MGEQGLGIAVLADVVGRGDGRQADAGAATANFAHDGTRHFQQEAAAVGHRATIGVGAVVQAVAQELLDQVAVGRVDLHAVKAGVHRAAGGMAVVGHDAGNFFRGQRPRRRDIGKAAFDVGLGLGSPRAGRHRRGAIGQQRAVRDAAHMPELDDDLAAFGMHGVGDLPPRGHLLGAVDARGVQVALRHRADLAGFGDDEPGAGGRVGPLAVVLDHQLGGHAAGARAVARQRGHHQAVVQGDVAHLKGRKKRGVHAPEGSAAAGPLQ